MLKAVHITPTPASSHQTNTSQLTSSHYQLCSVLRASRYHTQTMPSTISSGQTMSKPAQNQAHILLSAISFAMTYCVKTP
mmetsp:Transcript_10495/g.18358  ORF Transcript_10495/g.18358 Transcript_10495/m.18358 type:complete len:80 (-) Transcript_10495:1228-1467(-)